MPRRIIDKIRNAIRTGNYDMTHHAVEEIAEDKLGIFDVESAILKGNRNFPDYHGLRNPHRPQAFIGDRQLQAVCCSEPGQI